MGFYHNINIEFIQCFIEQIFCAKNWLIFKLRAFISTFEPCIALPHLKYEEAGRLFAYMRLRISNLLYLVKIL